MSHHILHILTHGSRLNKSRGMLVCHMPDNDSSRELPIEDIRAVIVAAKGVTISLELVSALLEAGAVILHCNQSYEPTGITTGIERIIQSEAIFNQANRALKLHDRLWNVVVSAKVANQAAVLEKYGRNAKLLRRQVRNSDVNEAFCARYYWNEYFAIHGLAFIQRRGEDEKGINAKLNYGYAVIGALVHRAIVAHGLSPVFGMHHVTRYKATALVYDLIEPWRPFVDDFLVAFETDVPDTGDDISKWAGHVAKNLKDQTIECGDKNLKLLDVIDRYVSTIARCYAKKSVRYAWMPLL